MLIDAHTHTHLRSPEDLDRMARAGITGVVVCAFLPVRPGGPDTLLDLFRWLLEEERARLGRAGLAARVAVGVHPRCIPARGLDVALARVGELLAGGAAAALGEVGLETGSAEERAVLAAQLDLARRVGSPVVVHTPRARKDELLGPTLELVAASGIDPARVVVDHLRPEHVGRVHAAGAVAGLTIQAGKLEPAEVLEIVSAHGADGLVLDSDVAHVPGDPTATARTRALLEEAGVAADAVRAIAAGTAARLFGFEG